MNRRPPARMRPGSGSLRVPIRASGISALAPCNSARLTREEPRLRHQGSFYVRWGSRFNAPDALGSAAQPRTRDALAPSRRPGVQPLARWPHCKAARTTCKYLSQGFVSGQLHRKSRSRPFWGCPNQGIAIRSCPACFSSMPQRITASRSKPRRGRLGSASGSGQLRVAAGLTQSELASDRFSKGTSRRSSAARPGRPWTRLIGSRCLSVDAGYLASGVSADEREAEAILARADAHGRAALRRRRGVPRRALGAVLGTGSQELHVRTLAGEATALAHHGEPRIALGLPRRRARSRRARVSATSTAPTHPLPPRRVPVPARAISTAVNLFNEALPSASAPASRPTGCARRLQLALALLPPPARLRGRARTELALDLRSGCTTRAR